MTQSGKGYRRLRRLTSGICGVLAMAVLVAAQGDFREAIDVSRFTEGPESVDVSRFTEGSESVDVSRFTESTESAEQREAERAARREAAFHQRLESARSLLAAYARTVEEQALGDSAVASIATMREGLDRAEARFVQGERDKARELLEDVNLRVKLSLQAALDGTTHYLTLDFDSAEEEYRYEQSRHETHRQLARHFMSEREVNETARGLVLQALEESDGLRGRAQDEASRDEHDAAIASLEAATRQLIRALRSVGIFIPG